MINILAIFRANFFLKIYLWKIYLILFLILDQCVKFASLQNGGGMCNQNSFQTSNNHLTNQLCNKTTPSQINKPFFLYVMFKNGIQSEQLKSRSRCKIKYSVSSLHKVLLIAKMPSFQFKEFLIETTTLDTTIKAI